MYADAALLTDHEEIGEDVLQLFHYLTGRRSSHETVHLMLAPAGLRNGIEELIRFEIEEAKKGRPASIRVKLNALEDERIIKLLYEASRAGVSIQAIVRGICSLVPGLPGLSDNIRIVSVVDRYLEHARVYEFQHGGEYRTFLASADWMTRNMDRRIEYAVPVFDTDVKRHLRHLLDLQLSDTVKARELRSDMTSVQPAGHKQIQSQHCMYEYIRSNLVASDDDEKP
jgi:polyphosphate kinase